MPYAAAGHVNSSEQFILSETPSQVSVEAKGKAPVLTEDKDAVFATAGKVVVAINKATGYLTGYQDAGRQLLKAPFAPNFWRAEIDNDWRGWKPSKYLKIWKTAHENISAPEILTSVEDNVAVITVRKTIGEDKAQLTLKYSVFPDGSLNVAYDIKIGDNVLEPIRIGLQGQVACGRKYFR